LARVYGEQFVADPWADIEMYFDFLSGRFYTRPIPTQMAVLFLFGDGKPYRPNSGNLSAAGEAVAGFCLERFGYKPLVRPIGIMPDALMWMKRGRHLYLALSEAKASVTADPHKKLLDNVYEFMVDIKTRADAFSSNYYEAYLTCCRFNDGGAVEVVSLHVDLSAYRKAAHVYDPAVLGNLTLKVEQTEEPHARLRDILRVQAETLPAGDEYLTGLLSEEATRTAFVAMLRDKRQPQGQPDVDQYIRERARETGVEQEWMAGQEMIREEKEREDESVRAALRRYRRRDMPTED
jgi:hypothetical protein